MSLRQSVAVVTGAGGMGLAVARRLAPSHRLVVADWSEQALLAASASLQAEGADVQAVVCDVGDAKAVQHLVSTAAQLGPIDALVHTAGLSPVQATSDAILRVDLVGTALIIEAFAAAMARGGAAVVIASMAGQLGGVSDELARALGTLPVEQLQSLPQLRGVEPAAAYGIAKRGNQARVSAVAAQWAARGLRINSVSPGVIATAMGTEELEGENGALIRELVDNACCGRLGTAQDIADAVAFLLSEQAGYIVGTDLLVDGGVTAALLAG